MSSVAHPAAAAPDPSSIVRLSTAYWESQTLLTANRLRLFDALADGARSADEVAAALQLDPRSTALLLRACVGLGFLKQAAGRFENTPVAATFLVSRSPAFMGNVIRYSDQLYATWGKLEDALRTGKPALPAEAYLGDDPARTRGFVMAMHERAQGIARALVPILDLQGRKTMLDVGGGPGTYSVLLTERFPGLCSEVLELPGVAAVARELVAAAGASARVTLRDGDYHVSDFGSGKDVVLMSGMFHRESAQTCRNLIERAAACLNPGGLLVVSDVFTDEGGAQPTFAAMFEVRQAASGLPGLKVLRPSPDRSNHRAAA